MDIEAEAKAELKAEARAEAIQAAKARILKRRADRAELAMIFPLGMCWGALMGLILSSGLVIFLEHLSPLCK